jgi:hypothetical protein
VLDQDSAKAFYTDKLGFDERFVTFLSEPADRPYGIEATLRDDSGNMVSLVQPAAFE